MVTTGYDMSMVGTIPGEAEALAAIDPLWNAAIKHRDSFPKEARGTFDPVVDQGRDWGACFANADPGYVAAQAEVMRLSDEQDAANRSYFRLNIWGMGRYRDAMELVGMGHWSEHEEWPSQADYGITNEQSWSYDAENDNVEDEDTWDAMDEATRQQVRKFQADSDAVRASHPGETPGIPLFKFGSNDGWHVTPDECSSALQIFGEWLSWGLGNTWEDALNAFRKQDEAVRKIVIASAAARHQMSAALVGHGPILPGEEDDRKTQFDVYAEDYWLQWLQFLTDGVHAGGFKVY